MADEHPGLGLDWEDAKRIFNEFFALSEEMRDNMTTKTDAEAEIKAYNANNFKKAVEGLKWANDVEITVGGTSDAYTITTSGMEGMRVVDPKTSANDLKFDSVALPDFKQTSSSINNSSTLASMGIDDGEIKINGVTITVNDAMTVKTLIDTVNNSGAGVVMSFSALTGTFSVNSIATGANSRVDLVDVNGTGIFEGLGIGSNAEERKAGTNLQLTINGQSVETSGSSYTIDGTTFAFASTVAEGTEITVEVGKTSAGAVDAIKSFVNDYNNLIKDIFGMVNEKPDKKYHFLTDYDLEEMELSDRQQQQWEDKAKLGLLNRDSAITDIMSRMRMSMMTSVMGSSGRPFTIFDIKGNDGTAAMKPSSDYAKNGQLEFNEQALIEALERNPEDIMKLFTDKDTGIMVKIEQELERAVSTKLDDYGNPKGILVQRAGLATGYSAMKNSLYDKIKNLNSLIDTLQTRYEKQQDRYWRIFSGMEKQLGAINSQSSYIANMFGNM
ncbi:MAG: flagellar filament capping protein FliD, partial [Oscillospiraceae bacterium]|nr:flagellar filament capping protein FliD [Oscillospiraceae bacterium]